jgi:hypothetical protein
MGAFRVLVNLFYLVMQTLQAQILKFNCNRMTGYSNVIGQIALVASIDFTCAQMITTAVRSFLPIQILLVFLLSTKILRFFSSLSRVISRDSTH